MIGCLLSLVHYFLALTSSEKATFNLQLMHVAAHVYVYVDQMSVLPQVLFLAGDSMFRGS